MSPRIRRNINSRTNVHFGLNHGTLTPKKVQMHERRLQAKPKTKLKQTRIIPRQKDISLALIEALQTKPKDAASLMKEVRQRIKKSKLVKPEEITMPTLRRSMQALIEYEIVE